MPFGKEVLQNIIYFTILMFSSEIYYDFSLRLLKLSVQCPLPVDIPLPDSERWEDLDELNRDRSYQRDV